MQQSKTSLNCGGLGCLGFAGLVGFLFGLNINGSVLPNEWSWAFAVSFAIFFVVLGYILGGISFRTDHATFTQTIMTIPPYVATTLKAAIEAANPPSHLTLPQVASLDADLASLNELALLLKRDPQAGTSSAIREHLEDLAVKWLDEEDLTRWLAQVQPENSENPGL